MFAWPREGGGCWYVHASAYVPEFGPLTFLQKSAAWYGAKVQPHRVFWLIGDTLTCHPNTARYVERAVRRRAG